MTFLRAKKHLGQHFLKDENIAHKIVNSLNCGLRCKKVLEIGPGKGILTKYLINEKSFEIFVVEIDKECVSYLEKTLPDLKGKIISADFLKLKLDDYFKEPFAVIGNFPYNISSQILFKVLDYRNLVPEVVGMFQKEVAERIAATPKNKSYGIMSVLMQAFYEIEYLFTVNETVFSPPPRVKSAVIRLTRNSVEHLGCDEKLFLRLVKTAFNQRRKTLRNALKQFNIKKELSLHRFFSQRAEELSVQEFVELTNLVEQNF